MLSCALAPLCFQKHIWFATRTHISTALCLDASMVSSPLVLTAAPPQTQHELKQIWWKERGSRRSIHSTRAYWSCCLHQRAMCRTTARSALFPVTGLANKPNKIQIKPWRTCCAKPITHAENAACSSLHTSTSGIHISLMPWQSVSHSENLKMFLA